VAVKPHGWRKYTVAMAALVIGFVLALLGKLSAEFATIAAVAVGAFAAGNAVEHYKK
jgi:uncharacterized membrane protein YjjB (DUF3815 family)